MLDIKASKDSGAQVMATGRTGEILTELAIVSNIIYRQMCGDDEQMAQEIKMLIRMAVMDDNSPYWKDLSFGDESTAVRIEIPKQ